MTMNDPNKIIGYGWEFTFVGDQWISKAIPFAKHAVHGEKPAFNVCEVLEEKYVQAFEQSLHNAIVDVDKYLVVPANDVPKV